MGYPRITDTQKSRYLTLRGTGLSQARAAAKAGFSERSGKALEQGLRNSSGDVARQARLESKLPAPIRFDELGPEARRAWDDFEFFRRRYFGHLSTPWQVETAEVVVGALASPDQEFIVENCPPGAGKSTLARDIAAWVTVRNRRLRGLFGSRVENNARRQLRALRRSLERTSPVRAKPEDLVRGVSVDAEATLAADFGFFKPLSSDIWKADEFVVAQFDDEATDEKEPTWSCYGQDSGVLGNRFEIIFWDDVVDRSTIRTTDAIESQRSWWDDEAEPRLEPWGTLFLIGQRMGASDLYRFCLDKEADDGLDEGEDDDEPVDDPVERPKVYRHVVYQAHYDDRCRGRETHRPGAAPYPDGCLLDPYRLAWPKLRNIRRSKPQTYAIQYQQGDAQPDGVLASEAFVYGGVDDDGNLHPGCVDGDRGLCELPKGLAGPHFSVGTVDPSGKKMWAVQWWVYTPEAAGRAWLMDLERKAMPANDLLDRLEDGTFRGIMEEWQVRSAEFGLPITHWIVEVNAAQTYLLAYDHVRKWMTKRRTLIRPHTTGPRKLNEDYGPWITQDWWKHGRFRLPWSQRGMARIQSLKLIDEALRWPNPGGTDDEVMASWFFVTHVPMIAVTSAQPKRQWRPHWMRQPA